MASDTSVESSWATFPPSFAEYQPASTLGQNCGGRSRQLAVAALDQGEPRPIELERDEVTPPPGDVALPPVRLLGNSGHARCHSSGILIATGHLLRSGSDLK